MTRREFDVLLERVKALSPEQMRWLRREIESELAGRGPVAGESAFDVLDREGLIGCLPGEPGSPTDLATDPRHLEGFGGE